MGQSVMNNSGNFQRCESSTMRCEADRGKMFCTGHSEPACIDISKGVEGILAQLGMEAHIPAFHKVRSIQCI